jgi:hypothetical protein
MEMCCPGCGQQAGRAKEAVVPIWTYRLIFEVDMDVIPRRPDGGIDVGAVDGVVLIEIRDTH